MKECAGWTLIRKCVDDDLRHGDDDNAENVAKYDLGHMIDVDVIGVI